MMLETVKSAHAFQKSARRKSRIIPQTASVFAALRIWRCGPFAQAQFRLARRRARERDLGACESIGVRVGMTSTLA
jgi:GH24 family phage-related lysozyme (muramidase)